MDASQIVATLRWLSDEPLSTLYDHRIRLVRVLSLLTLTLLAANASAAGVLAREEAVAGWLLVYLMFLLGEGGIALGRRSSDLPYRYALGSAAAEIMLLLALALAGNGSIPGLYLAFSLPMAAAAQLTTSRPTFAIFGLALLSNALAVLAGGGGPAEWLAALGLQSLVLVAASLLFLRRRRSHSSQVTDAEAAKLLGSMHPIVEGIFSMDDAGRLLYVNEALAQRLGEPQPDLRCSEYFGCNAEQCSHCPLTLALESAEGDTREVELRDLEGRCFQVSIGAVFRRLGNEGPPVIVGSVRDRTHEQENKLQLRREMNRNRELQDERLRWLDTFQKLGTKLAKADKLDALLRNVVEEAQERLHAETCAVFQVEGKIARRIKIAGLPDDWFKDEAYQVGVGITGEVLLKGGYQLVNNVDEDPRVPQEHLKRYSDRLRSGRVRHLIAVPLVADDRVIGVLRVVNRLGDDGKLSKSGFRRRDRYFLQTIAAMAAIAIENRRLAQEAEQRFQTLERLTQATEAVRSNLDMSTTLETITRLAGEVLGSDHSSLALVNDAGEIIDSFEDPNTGHALHIRARPGGITRQVIRSRLLLRCDDIDVEPSEKHNPFLREHGLRAYVAVPIIASDDTVRGVLFVHSREPGRFRDREELLEVFSYHAAVAIDQARIYDAIGRLVALMRELHQKDHDPAIFQFIVKQCAQLFGAEQSSLYLVNPDHETLELKAASRVPSDIWRRHDMRLDGPGLTAYAIRSAEVLNLSEDEYRAHPHWAGGSAEGFQEHLAYLPSEACHSLLIVPFGNAAGEMVGAIKLENRLGDGRGKRFPPYLEDLFRSLASIVGMVVERQRLIHQVQEQLRDEAWGSFSLEMHLIQGAPLLNVQRIGRLKQAIEEAEMDRSRALVDEVDRINRHVCEQLKRIFDYTHNPQLRTELVQSLQAHACSLSGLEPDWREAEDLELDVETVYPLLRIGQEALSNAHRHAGIREGAKVSVSLRDEGGHVVLCVRDDGCGFDVDAARARPDAYGLLSMDSWARKFGVECRLESVPLQGTRVTVRATRKEGTR